MRRRIPRTPPRRLDVYAAAKVNIGFEVGALRPDGYHEVRGLVHTVSLADRLLIEVHEDDAGVAGDVVIEAGDAPVGFTVTGDEAGAGLASADNLVLRAARAVGERILGRPTSIRLDKAIPVAAGLGGGSADAAAALMGLSMAWSGAGTVRDLLEMGAGIGSDVPAILVGGLVHVSGRGEVVRNVGCATGTAFVLGVCDQIISAAAGYRVLDDLRSRGSSPDGGRDMWSNDLEAAAVEIVPELAGALEAMRDAGAPMAFVSGSGPTVVGVVPEAEGAEGVAAAAAPAFRRTIAVSPSAWGVRLVLGPRHAEGAMGAEGPVGAE